MSYNTFSISYYLFRSVLNILLRYGYRHDLNFVFGTDNNAPPNLNFFETKKFKIKQKNDYPWHESLKNHQYDIWCFHGTWNKMLVR